MTMAELKSFLQLKEHTYHHSYSQSLFSFHELDTQPEQRLLYSAAAHYFF